MNALVSSMTVITAYRRFQAAIALLVAEPEGTFALCSSGGKIEALEPP